MNATHCLRDDAVCLLYQRLEPTLPLRAPLASSGRSACRNGHCFPLLHVLGGYHSFLEETLGTGKRAHGAQPDGLLSGHSMVEMQHRCHNEFDEGNTFDKQGGGPAFLTGWPRDEILIAECMTGMMWYPNLAARWSREWSAAYWPCKSQTIRREGQRAFRERLMWGKCKPAALAAHDAAHGTGGVGREATPPFLLRMLYPASASPKVVLVLRNPTERLETSYWLHPHYPRKYGQSAAGLARYVQEHIALFSACEARYGTRRCAFLFENLDGELNKGFFACDQVIRGVYWPFVAEWLSAFGTSGLLVIKAEQLLDDPAVHRPRVLSFFGLPPPPAGSTVNAGPPSYAAMHAATLRSYSAEPMLNRTRSALDAYYAPHNRRLAAMLGWDVAEGWPNSRPLEASAFARAATVRYRRYGPHASSNMRTKYDVAEQAVVPQSGGKAGIKPGGKRHGHTAGRGTHARSRRTIRKST